MESYYKVEGSLFETVKEIALLKENNHFISLASKAFVHDVFSNFLLYTYRPNKPLEKLYWKDSLSQLTYSIFYKESLASKRLNVLRSEEMPSKKSLMKFIIENKQDAFNPTFSFVKVKTEWCFSLKSSSFLFKEWIEKEYLKDFEQVNISPDSKVSHELTINLNLKHRRNMFDLTIADIENTLDRNEFFCHIEDMVEYEELTKIETSTRKSLKKGIARIRSDIELQTEIEKKVVSEYERVICSSKNEKVFDFILSNLKEIG